MNKFENLRVFWGDSDLNYLTISAKFGLPIFISENQN